MPAVSASPSQLARFGLARFRREWGAASLAARAVRRGWLFWAGRLYAWGAALSSGALMAWVASSGEPGAASQVLPAAVAGMSWAAGLVACAAARDLRAEERAMGMGGLWVLRGVSPSEQARARLVATILVVTNSLALPALLLSIWAMSLSRSVAQSFSPIPWLIGMTAYAVCFGLVLGVVARWASRLSAQHGRLVFLALALGPHLLRSAFEDVPSVVAGLAALLHGVAILGNLA